MVKGGERVRGGGRKSEKPAATVHHPPYTFIVKVADGGYHAPEKVTVKNRLRSYFGKEQVTEQKGVRHILF